MAKFIGLINNGGSFKTDEGEMRDYSNFTLHYADVPTEDDKIRNDEISCTPYRPYKVEKIPADKIAQFMGVKDVPSCHVFDSCFGYDIELKFGRNGVSGIRFINIDTKTGEITPRDVLNEFPFSEKGKKA